jgi:hypothetical protein
VRPSAAPPHQCTHIGDLRGRAELAPLDGKRARAHRDSGGWFHRVPLSAPPYGATQRGRRGSRGALEPGWLGSLVRLRRVGADGVA